MIPDNITQDHIERAISEIERIEIPTHRKEKHYQLIYEEKVLPPKYVLSIANKYANGYELESKEFNAVEAKQFLLRKGFKVGDKRIFNKESDQKYWVEKTIVHGRPDRIEGDRALGKALWSPKKDKRGADIYKNMRSVKEGDIVLHLINNNEFSGVSIVQDKAIETNGISDTEWDGPAYLIKLNNYIELSPKIKRESILNIQNKAELDLISNNSEVFYNKKLELRQGAYLTPCPIELVSLINEVYHNETSRNLPHIMLKELKKKQMVSETFNVSLFSEVMQKNGLFFTKLLITRFTASLLTKPFVILTGLSGSGKTKLAQAFAMWICEDDSQYSIVPVGADWTNREPLLGFPNALEKNNYVKPDNRVLDLIIDAYKNERKPYFLVLDEMNLSHVERYFADFLSVMESKNNIALHSGDDDWNDVPAKIGFPKNLFIIGTVNIDETTYMFSPKVLDRASVIEFRVTATEMNDYLQSNSEISLETLEGLGKNMAESFVFLSQDKSLEPTDEEELNKTLMKFFVELKKTGAEFGYRSASEIIRFAAVVNKLEAGWTSAEITDAAIMQKLLPKVHGSRRKLEPVLKTLGTLCLQNGERMEDYILKSEIDFTDSTKIKYPVSLEKILRMYHSLLSNGFTSYAEA